MRTRRRLLGSAGRGAPEWPLQTIAAPLLGSGTDWLARSGAAPRLPPGSEGIAWRRRRRALRRASNSTRATSPALPGAYAAPGRERGGLPAHLPPARRPGHALPVARLELPGRHQPREHPGWSATASSTSAARTPSSPAAGARPATCPPPAPSAWPADRCRSPSWPARRRRWRWRIRARSAPTSTRPIRTAQPDVLARRAGPPAGAGGPVHLRYSQHRRPSHRACGRCRRPVPRNRWPTSRPSSPRRTAGPDRRHSRWLNWPAASTFATPPTSRRCASGAGTARAAAASCSCQADICRADLLLEIEATARTPLEAGS